MTTKRRMSVRVERNEIKCVKKMVIKTKRVYA